MDVLYKPLMLDRASLNLQGIDEKTYLEVYAEQYAEWVEGEVIFMSPVMDVHDELVQFLVVFLRAYLEGTHQGILRHQPFVMQTYNLRKREPDLFVVLNDNLPKLEPSMMRGGADLVIEVLSTESYERDTDEKLSEYELSGVREYWILDPYGETHFFYVLNEQGKFERRFPQAEGLYTSAVLDPLYLNIQWFKQNPLPNLWEMIPLLAVMIAKTAHPTNNFDENSEK